MEDNQEISTEINNIEQSGALAPKQSRLFAAIIDGVMLIAIMLVLIMITGLKSSFIYMLFCGIITAAIFLLINKDLLINHGQTYGKKFLNIKIVTLDGGLPLANDHLMKRYAVYFVLGYLPNIGQLLSLVNILFIFGPEQRCLHDFAAGTKVVTC